jgi:hypothetical protein
LEANDRAAAYRAIGVAFRQRARREFEPVARHLHHVAAAQDRRDFTRRSLHHDRGNQLADDLAFLQGFLDRILELGPRGWKRGEAFRPAIPMAAVVFENARPQSRVRRLLVRATHGRIDAKPAHVGRFAVLFEDRGARHLGNVVGAKGEALALVQVEAKRLGHGLLVLVGREPADLAHAPQDVLLALLRAVRVREGILPRGGLRQAGEHRRLGYGQVPEALSEIDAGGRGEPIRPLAEEDLVHIELEDLVLGEVRLDLERQQDLGELASQGLFAGKEEGAGPPAW